MIIGLIFTVVKVDLVSGNAVLENCAETFPMDTGVMEYIQNCGILLARSALLLVRNWVIYLNHFIFAHVIF